MSWSLFFAGPPVWMTEMNSISGFTVEQMRELRVIKSMIRQVNETTEHKIKLLTIRIKNGHVEGAVSFWDKLLRSPNGKRPLATINAESNNETLNNLIKELTHEC